MRLCSSASAVPRLKRSRCTQAGVPVAHIPAVPALPGMHARPLCRSTPAMRCGADTGHRTRGLDHGVVALCLLSYIRLDGERAPHPVGQACSRQLVKEQSDAPMRVGAFRWNAKAGLPTGREKQKGPDPFGIRASMCDRVGGCAPYAPPSPGCIQSSSPSDQVGCWLLAGCRSFIVTTALARPKAARTNAHWPGRGSERVAMWPWRFTMNSWVVGLRWISVAALGCSEEADCKDSSPRRQADGTNFFPCTVSPTPGSSLRSLGTLGARPRRR